MNGVSSSGRSFHKSAAQAPGFSTRSASRLARSPSNQWNACPTTSRSTLAAGRVVASAVPFTLPKRACPPRRASAASRMPRLGSTARTRAPRARRSSVRIPVPEPTSATTAAGDNPQLASSRSMAAAG